VSNAIEARSNVAQALAQADKARAKVLEVDSERSDVLLRRIDRWRDAWRDASARADKALARVAELEAADHIGRICAGCGTSHDLTTLRAAGHISCCPERKMLTPAEAWALAARFEAEAARYREALTPSGDTKGELSGEFKLGRNIIPWDAIKAIMAAIRARAERPIPEQVKA
jgi:hypothetical protein